MKIDITDNGTHAITTYGNKLFYRESPEDEFVQIKRGFYRESINDEFVQIYLYDETPPEIILTSSTEDTLTKEYTITAIITDTESKLAEIYVNNIEYSITSGVIQVDLSKLIELVLGDNNIVIKAIDIAGNIQELPFVIKYLNQKDDPNTNWSNASASGVTVNGVWYKLSSSASASSPTSFVTAIASIGSTIPLPKGISYISGTIRGDGSLGINRSRGQYGTVTLRDNTTGTTLGSASFNGGASRDSEGQGSSWGTASASFGWSISREISMHDLTLSVSGQSSGDEHGYATASVGFTWGPPSLSWYS